RIVEHNKRVLSAHFELQLLPKFGASDGNLTAGGDGSCEGNGVDLGRLDDGLSHHGTTAHYQIEYAFRDAGLVKQVCNGPGATRHKIGRFENHAIAKSEGRRDLPCGNGDGEIPGSDDAHHAHWLPRDLHIHPRSHGGKLLSTDAQGLSGE